MSSILIVEDELKTGTYLRQGLQEAGYNVTLVNDGLQGLEHILKQRYDLIILDIMLPSMDGWDILRQMRMARHEEPVLFLTAKDNISEKIRGLDLGADDYLLKPFDFAELLARIRTQLRRNRSQTGGILTIADLTIDVARRSVSRSGKRIHLSSKEFSLLELLLQRRGEVLPRNLLSSLVWNINFESDTNVIDVAVRRLRSKIDDDFSPKLIHTVRGIGYVLEIREE
ncbi:MAG: heavy metal response regulator transcription factor [Pantoea sp.]|uniref:DNA-binding response regulator n=2 Tax=Bacteria TaxID=2 RepID=A0ABX3URW3_9GAMM|nr:MULTISPECIES: heavy metal response regulator transcription factor [Pantoea]MBS6034401.1 heavy metal response regulator transcription factor [Pantoea sp.]MBS6437796.1 heavy metal response regulator transcription factor [Pantoea sp.]MDU1575718.1 heavy metal response regulator transcription factor [Pantoea sp.]MDU2730408.1 heavy metal response regulator transcription factor [Pantoea sp.]MDU5475664.1 heavy metal response regulator transcription factor [Pantoea sp.]